MKKTAIIIASAITVFTSFTSVSAQMVDIGSGQMPASEFVALKAMVAGQPHDTASRVSTPIVRQENYGMVAMTPSEFAVLRDRVAGRTIASAAAGTPRRAVEMVNIGTGQMPLEEFIALKKMVEKSGSTVFTHLASSHP